MSSTISASPIDLDIAELLKHLPKDAFSPALLVAQRQSGVKVELPRTDPPAGLGYRVEDHAITVEGGEIIARCIIPKVEDEGPFPVLVWFHGGAYCVGSMDIDDQFLSIISVKNRVVVVNVDYRLAPEFPFPAGVNDAFEALKWAATNAERLSASTSKGFIVTGNSSGANFAASIALRARDDPFFKDRPLTGQALVIPQVLHPKANPEKYRSDLLSMEENKDSPIITRSDLEQMADIYGADPLDTRYSVLLAPDHRGLPPTYFQVAMSDPLRDEALVYEKVLKSSGVKTKLDIYPGLPHGGHSVFPEAAISVKFNQDFEDGIRWLLENSNENEG